MGYGYYKFSDGRPRGYMVPCKCHKRRCKERIDRGMAYLCYWCTWYFCHEHLTYARVEVECFAGEEGQVCFTCNEVIEQGIADGSIEPDEDESDAVDLAPGAPR